MALGCSVPALHTGAVPQTRGATARREETVSMRRGEPEGVERTRWEREVLSEWEGGIRNWHWRQRKGYPV